MDIQPTDHERLLPAIFDAIQDGISVLDKELNILRINRTIENWYPYPGPMEGRKCYEVYHGKTEPCNICPSIRALESGNLQRDIVPGLVSQEAAGWLELFAFPMLDSAGKPHGVVEYLRDVTDRVKAEQAQLKGQQGWMAHMCRPVYGNDGHFLERRAGNRNISDRNRADEALQKAHHEKERRLTERRAGLLRTNELLAQEIEERMLVEGELQKSEEMYRMLVETMNEGLTIIDENMVLTYANKRFLVLTDYSENEVLGRRATDFFDAPNRKILQAQIRKRRKGGNQPYEIVWTGKDGRRIPTIVSPQPVFDDTGNYKGGFAVITDITALKQTESALRKREKELETQAGNLEDANTALEVLLQKREQDQTELEEKVLLNIRKLAMPYLNKLKKSPLDQRQEAFLSILESSLDHIVSPFTRHLSIGHLNLTPREIEVANLVRYGKTTKEIAEILNLSRRTIESHRKNLRRKLGLGDKRSNLRAYLLSLA